MRYSVCYTHCVITLGMLISDLERAQIVRWDFPALTKEFNVFLSVRRQNDDYV